MSRVPARLAPLALVLVLLVVAGPVVLAHEVTYKGTVASVETGKTIKLRVNVVDEKTKKTTAMPFEADEETDIYRGAVKVKLADAAIQKGEAITLVVNTDDSKTMADTIHLPAKK